MGYISVFVVLIAVVVVNNIDVVPIAVTVYIWFSCGQKSLLEATIVVFVIFVFDDVVDIVVVNDFFVVLVVVADCII